VHDEDPTSGDRAPTGGPDLRRIAELFEQLGRDVVQASAGETLESVARAAVHHVPGAAMASITVLDGDRFRTVTSTDPTAERADRIQYELGSGPCVDAILDDALYRPNDLRHDDRWPEYGRRVSEEYGILSMLSYRLGLEVGDAVMGLNLYGTEVDAFDEEATVVGLVLATHGAFAGALAAQREKAENLMKALASNRDIGVAIGVLMARHNVTREQSFDLLRISSQRSNRKLHQVALDVAETGELPPLRTNR
jgi:hypothetical protein